MLYILDKTEISTAIDLYANGFNVNKSIAETIVCNFAGDIYASRDNDIIKGIICASPIALNGKNGVILHGGATLPQYRGKGVFKALFMHAVQNNRTDFCVVENIDGHRAFYEGRGFENAFAMREITREIKRNLWAKADFDTITTKRLCDYRERLLKGSCIALTQQQVGVLLSSLYSNGISSAETAKAYALYYRLKDKLFVTELYAQSDVDAWFLLEAIADRDARNVATIILSSENAVFAGEGKPFFAGMISQGNNALANFLGELPK